MRQSARAVRVSVLLALSGSLLTGCANNPFNFQPGGQSLRAPVSPAVAQYRDMQSRAAGLDGDNQQLHALLAQQQQQNQQMQAALQQSQRDASELRHQGDGAGSVARRGVSARSASHGGALPIVRIQGADVVQDGDLVRIRMESSQLFAAGRAELKPGVNATLDRVAQALKADYAGRLVGVEGHTDSDPITKSKWKSNHELAVARSVALFQALKQRGVAESQLFVAGFGPNRPLAGGNSKQSKSQNRRVEIVVYPEMAGS
ncbi:MAG TPA: OmpA family protein [Planctomycetaceae bacterium]|nr:OmpA family protein [Planctomycetaceae bacterium]